MDDSTLETLHRTIDAKREEAAGLLGRLVRIPSVTGLEGEMQRAVEEELRRRDLDVDRWEATPEEMSRYEDHVGEQSVYSDRPNLVGTRRGRGDGRSIILNAHVDTVEAGDPANWSRDPHSGDFDGTFVYGRGSCDMKGGLVTFLVALDALDEVGIGLSGDVKLAATVGEEDGGLGALSAVLRGHRADAVAISEPTGLKLVAAQGGSVVFRLTVPGRSAHAAVRDEGVSAFEKFLSLYDALAEFEVERNATLSHRLYDHLSNKVPINVGIVHAGNWASTVPESLVAEVRAGLVPGEDLGDFKRLLEDRLRYICEEDDWLSENPPEVSYFGGQFAPSEVSPDSEICRAFDVAHRRATGGIVTVEGVAYGSDMRHFVNVGGMPCVMYGAGDVNLAHAPDERISIDDLLVAAKTYANLLVSWCGAER